MDALIKVKVSELNEVLVARIKALFKGKEDAELTIRFDENQYLYDETLKRSKENMENGHDLVTFTMEELEAYTTNKNRA